MTKRNRLRFFLAATLLFGCTCCWARPHSHGPLMVCSVVSAPHKFAGKRVTVRGLIIYPTGDAAPPPLITGNCAGGITFFEGGSGALQNSEGYKALLRAVWKPSPDSSLQRHIWATLSGTVRFRGGRPYLELSDVSSVEVLPNLRVKSAEVPRYPEDAAIAGLSGRVQVVAVIVGGAVSQARVIGKADPSLSKAALKNVRTWSFYPLVNTTVQATFVYRLRKRSSWPPPDNPQIKMDLPHSVTITDYVK